MTYIFLWLHWVCTSNVWTISNIIFFIREPISGWKETCIQINQIQQCRRDKSFIDSFIPQFHYWSQNRLTDGVLVRVYFPHKWRYHNWRWPIKNEADATWKLTRCIWHNFFNRGLGSPANVRTEIRKCHHESNSNQNPVRIDLFVSAHFVFISFLTLTQTQTHVTRNVFSDAESFWCWRSHWHATTDMWLNRFQLNFKYSTFMRIVEFSTINEIKSDHFMIVFEGIPWSRWPIVYVLSQCYRLKKADTNMENVVSAKPLMNLILFFRLCANWLLNFQSDNSDFCIDWHHNIFILARICDYNKYEDAYFLF